MSSINLSNPSSNEAYSYQIEPLYFPEEHEKSQVAINLGNRINPDYESGAKYTPVQKKRIIAIAIASFSFLASAITITAACAAQLYPLAALAAPFICLGLGSGAYAIFKRKDLDSPKYRAKVEQEIKNLSLKTLASKHDLFLVVGYKLLDGIPSDFSDLEQQIQFYAKYQQLVHKLDQLDDWKQGQLQRVQNVWNRETKAMRDWYDDQCVILEQRKAIRNQSEFGMYAYTRYQEERTGRRAPGLRAVNTMVGVSNLIGDVADHYEYGSVSQIYGEKMGPWNRWLETEKVNIKRAYSQALSELEDQFVQIKLDVIKA